MMYIFRLFLYFLIFNFFDCAGTDPQKLEEMVSPEEIKKTEDKYLQMLISGSNQFAFDLYQISKARQDNFVLASYALTEGLSMIGVGGKGETRKEIQDALHFSLNLGPFTQTINQYMHVNAQQTRQFQLSLLNGVWLQNEGVLLPSYKYALKRDFNFVLTPLDFTSPSKVLSKINNWFSNQSRNKIHQMVSYQDLSRGTELLLTTALYWKGEWVYPFDVIQTQKAPFTYKGHTFNVEMMHQIANYPLFVEPRFSLIEIPYKPLQEGGAQLSLTILLPNEGIPLNSLENELVPEQWYKWMHKLTSQRVELFLPKLRIEEQVDLSEELQKMGIRQAFAASADFSGISEKSMHLSKVLQKVMIPIDEIGSGYSSSLLISAQPKNDQAPQVIKANRAFFYVIQEMTTRLILCIGKIEHP